MSDKRAAKLKKKRKSEKMEAQRRLTDEIAAGVQERRRLIGKPPIKVSKSVIYNTWKRAQNKAFSDCVTYALFASCKLLGSRYGWGHVRLQRYIKRLAELTVVISSGERSLEQLGSEILYETGVNSAEIPGFEQSEKAAPEHKFTLEACGKSVPLMLYPLYFDEGWKKKRLGRFFHELVSEIKHMLMFNKLAEYRDYTVKRVRMVFHICDKEV